MELSKFKQAVLLCLMIVSVYACSKKKGNEPEGEKPGIDRKALLTYLADDIIIPSYIGFKTKFDLMLTKADAFTATPTTTTLTEFRTAWVNAYVEWQKIELIDVGPANNQVIRSFFNIYPTNIANVNAAITSGAVNLDLPASFAQQGFPALDYLINGLANNDNDIVAFYTTDVDAAKRTAYLKKITSQMGSIFEKVYTPWISGTYRNEFISKSGTDASSSLAVMVNGYVLNYERYIRSGKFGIPSGAMLNGVVSAEKVEGMYKKDISLTLAKTAQQASVDFFNGKSVKTGTEGQSFKTYLDALNAKDSQGVKLSQTILNQFAATATKLNLLTENLNNEVKTSNQKMIDVYTEMQKSVKMLKVDMTSAMSITITYTDNDGD